LPLRVFSNLCFAAARACAMRAFFLRVLGHALLCGAHFEYEFFVSPAPCVLSSFFAREPHFSPRNFPRRRFCARRLRRKPPKTQELNNKEKKI